MATVSRVFEELDPTHYAYVNMLAQCGAEESMIGFNYPAFRRNEVTRMRLIPR